MKKLSLLIVAAAVAVSASAGVGIKASRATMHNKLVNTELTKVKVKDLKAKNDLRVITTQPEGELKSYTRAGQAIYPSGQSFYYGDQDGRMDIVFGENGKVYMKNILYNIGSFYGDSWVEGQISEDGNFITVPMGQSICWSDDYQADVVLAWGSTTIAYNEEGNPYVEFTPDERTTEVVYQFDGPYINGPMGIAPVESETETYWRFIATGLGCYWTDDASFGGALEWNTQLTETEPFVVPTVITEQPEGQLYTYWRNSQSIYNSYWFGINASETDGKVNVVFGNNGEVYIQNPLWYHDSYNTWVKGSYDWMTGVITIPTGQFLMYNEAYEYGVQMVWGNTYVYEDGVDEETGEPNYYIGMNIDERTTEIYFQIDDDVLYLLGTDGDINAEFPLWGNATGMMGIYSDDQSMTTIEFAKRDEYGHTEPFGRIVNVVPAIPADPIALEWYDEGDESGYNYIRYTLPTTDINGNAIDPEYLSYSIWVDKGNGPELFTFDYDSYNYDISEDMTEIPYWIYSGGYDFHSTYTYFYRTFTGAFDENGNLIDGIEPLFTHNIGIQVFYTVDGVKNASNIAWVYDPDTKVNEINAGKTVESVRYFNIAGQEMAQPSGMTIQVTTYTDGTTSAAKVVK